MAKRFTLLEIIKKKRKEKERETKPLAKRSGDSFRQQLAFESGLGNFFLKKGNTGENEEVAAPHEQTSQHGQADRD